MELVPTVAGGWLGTYAYLGILAGSSPVRFEATFVAYGESGSFKGTILDDKKSRDATVAGIQTNSAVMFTKLYLEPNVSNGQIVPIEYEGTLSEDGKRMSGTWRFSTPSQYRILPGHGVWDAHRLWSEELAVSKEWYLQALELPDTLPE